MTLQSSERTAIQILDVLRGGDGNRVAGQQALELTMLQILQELRDEPAPAPAPAGSDIPAGIQFVPGPAAASAGRQFFVTMFTDTAGDPTRCVVVASISTSTVSIMEYKRVGETWVFDPADCAFDVSVPLTFTASNIAKIHAFAIDDPVGTGDRVLFISTNDGSQSPDTFEINSIVLTPGAASLTAVASVITGANQPTDTDLIIVINIPLSTTRLMSIFEDDAHFADITEAAGTYTFTYTDSKVEAIDTSINPNNPEYSGIVIGSQVVLARLGSVASSCVMWEMSTAAVLTEEFNPFAVGGVGTYQAASTLVPAGITAIGGRFAVASPVGGGDAPGDDAAYYLTTFPLDDI